MNAVLYTRSALGPTSCIAAGRAQPAASSTSGRQPGALVRAAARPRRNRVQSMPSGAARTTSGRAAARASIAAVDVAPGPVVARWVVTVVRPGRSLVAATNSSPSAPGAAYTPSVPPSGRVSRTNDMSTPTSSSTGGGKPTVHGYSATSPSAADGL